MLNIFKVKSIVRDYLKFERYFLKHFKLINCCENYSKSKNRHKTPKTAAENFTKCQISKCCNF